jgi:hypothetical protein
MGVTMRGKLLLLVGLGAGYVLGTRAGREKYDQLKSTVTGFWEDPRVKKQVKNVQEFAKDKAPEVVDFVTDTTKKVTDQIGGKASGAKSSSSSSTKPTSTAK